MRRHFYLVMSGIFWLLMMVGFSDNWLTDINQANNANPAFMIHALFAFSWFSLALVQTGLISASHRASHMRVGMAGVLAFVGFLASTLFLYFEKLAAAAWQPAPLTLLNITLLTYATILISQALLVRDDNAELHKRNILIGNLMLIEPALSRALSKLGFGAPEWWLISYLLLFSVFIWFYRRIPWQLGAGISLWIVCTTNLIASM